MSASSTCVITRVRSTRSPTTHDEVALEKQETMEREIGAAFEKGNLARDSYKSTATVGLLYIPLPPQVPQCVLQCNTSAQFISDQLPEDASSSLDTYTLGNNILATAPIPSRLSPDLNVCALSSPSPPPQSHANTKRLTQMYSRLLSLYDERDASGYPVRVSFGTARDFLSRTRIPSHLGAMEKAACPRYVAHHIIILNTLNIELSGVLCTTGNGVHEPRLVRIRIMCASCKNQSRTCRRTAFDVQPVVRSVAGWRR